MTLERIPSDDYESFLQLLTQRIAQAQLRAVLAVNTELVLLYWQLGRDILERQQQQGWGAKVIEQLAHDLRHHFPEMRGFSRRNLLYMRAFAAAWPDEAIVQQLAAQIPWFHNCVLLDKLDDAATRMWYAQQASINGWSRDILVHQIEAQLHKRQGQAITNFRVTLPTPQSDLASQLLKDPYNFDFLSLGEMAQERDLERGLLTHLQHFLLELGFGFAFVGNQYHLEIGGQDFYLDLLFYHLQLRCYVVIDLKIGDFKPEDVGKMNFYLAAVDNTLRHSDDQASIGLLLCKSRNQIIVEYALRDIHKPIGVATYQLTRALPETLQGKLPTIVELEATLSELDIEDDSPTY